MAICTLECIFLSSMSFKLCKLFLFFYEKILFELKIWTTHIVQRFWINHLRVLKYIQEYMISNCLHVIWINYYLDSYVENLCMETLFSIQILIWYIHVIYLYQSYAYIIKSFIHFRKKKTSCHFSQMYLLFLFLCLLLNVVLQHTSL